MRKAKGLNLSGDNYATHQHLDIQKWPIENPQFSMHPPPSVSWLNMVERASLC